MTYKEEVRLFMEEHDIENGVLRLRDVLINMGCETLTNYKARTQRDFKKGKELVSTTGDREERTMSVSDAMVYYLMRSNTPELVDIKDAYEIVTKEIPKSFQFK